MRTVLVVLGVLALLALLVWGCNIVVNRPPASSAPAAPAGPAASTYASLKYDETNGTALITGQSKLIALYIRDAMGQNGTQQAMEAAISNIQVEAQNTKATVFESSSLQLDQRQAWLVWCSNADTADFPTDTSDVMDKLRHGPGRIWIQVPFAQGVPLRSKDSFSDCTGGKFWAVAVH